MTDVPTFDTRWQARPPPPRDQGRVRLVVARLAHEKKAVLDEGRFTQDEGLVDDRWTLADDEERLSQVTLMEAAVVETLTGGQLVPTSGDNLLVDFDLSAAALPAGATLRVGTAVFEVTPEPHDGCKKFTARFGQEAMRWVAQEKAQRRRGIHAKVLVDGVVRPGDVIERA